jgi:hypothetical protein
MPGNNQDPQANIRNLTSNSIFVLLEFMSRRQIKKVGRKNRVVVVNNGEIVFTYHEAKKNFRLYKSTFCRSIDQLVEFGFIDIAHHGGGMNNDYSKYGISDRWEKYGRKEFIKSSRQKDTRGLGFTEENWEKITGRKRKPKSKVSIKHDTRSGITNDTLAQQMTVTTSTTHATLKTDPNYYIQKGLEVFETMYSTQYH